MPKLDKLGIIPAAGEGKRWGGFQKMLLPIGGGDWLIDRSIRALQFGGCNRIVVVTNPVSLAPLVYHLFGKYKNLSFIMNDDMDKDMYGSILATFPHSGDLNYFVMPDTYFSEGIFLDIPEGDFLMGTHKTKHPERFGVLHNNEVFNKKNDWTVELTGTKPPTIFKAWGCLVWSKECVELWKAAELENYTDAINLAIVNFGVNKFDMGFYHDMATFEDYKKLLEVLDDTD